MKHIAVMTSTPDDLEHGVAAVDSLLLATQPPDEIILALPLSARYKIPSVLRHNSRVRLERTEYDYGSLTGLVCALELYGDDAAVTLVLVSSTMRYPKNLLQEISAIKPELEKQLRAKMPQYTSSVWGLGGTVMVRNKEHNMELELQALMAGEDVPAADARSIIGYVRDNATIDILETAGVIVFDRNQIVKRDFMALVEPFRAGLAAQQYCGDVLLSNYFGGRGVFRTQICTLSLNRFMLEVCGYSDRRRRRSKPAKEAVIANTVKALQSANAFRLWK